MPKGAILPWEEKLEALNRYHDSHGGSTLVPQSFVDPESGFRLGRWVANLRQRVNFLTENQLRDLNKVGFVWTYRSKVMPWSEKMELLRQYKARHGDLLVPKEYLDPGSGFRLGGMVDRLRQSKSTLNKARVQELDELGFVWNKYEAHWESMFQLLKEYKTKYNHTCPSTQESFMGKPLGQWVAVQKQLFSRKQRQVAYNASMPENRVAKLESIGFEWSWKRGGGLSYKAYKNDYGVPGQPDDESFSSISDDDERQEKQRKAAKKKARHQHRSSSTATADAPPSSAAAVNQVAASLLARAPSPVPSVAPSSAAAAAVRPMPVTSWSDPSITLTAGQKRTADLAMNVLQEYCKRRATMEAQQQQQQSNQG